MLEMIKQYLGIGAKPKKSILQIVYAEIMSVPADHYKNIFQELYISAGVSRADFKVEGPVSLEDILHPMAANDVEIIEVETLVLYDDDDYDLAEYSFETVKALRIIGATPISVGHCKNYEVIVMCKYTNPVFHEKIIPTINAGIIALAQILEK